MEFKTQYAHICSHEVCCKEDYTGIPSQTQPGLVDSLETIVKRFVAGVPLEVGKQGYYDDTDGTSEDVEDTILDGVGDITDLDVLSAKQKEYMAKVQEQSQKSEQELQEK